MYSLYPHQQKVVDDVRIAFSQGYRKVCLQAPTGMGKTVVATHIMQNAIEKGSTVMFIVHRKELIRQTQLASEKAGLIEYGYISAQYPYTREKPLYFASTNTLARRFLKLPKPDLIVYDEFHHAVSKTSLEFLKHYNDVPLIGLTATPRRLDGRGLKLVADTIVKGPSVRWLIDNEYLSEYEYFCTSPDIDFSGIRVTAGDYNAGDLDEALGQTTIIGKAAEHYLKYIPGQPAIGFCLNIKQSKKTAAEFRAMGIPAAHLDGTMSDSERWAIDRDFRAGVIKVLFNVNLFTEGYDVPACNGVFLLRPTLSETIFLQSVGRGLRKNGTDICYIFDHVENIKRHGLPCDDREWDLEGRIKRKKKKKDEEEEIDIVICSNCDRAYSKKKHPKKICPFCSFQEEITARELVEVEGELTKVDKTRFRLNQCKTIQEFEILAKKLNKNPEWAQQQMRMRDQWIKRYQK
jgi:DNA repair protein RadD